MAKVVNSRRELAKNAQKFISDGCKILIHSKSRAVFQILKEAHANNKHFAVYVTESAPDYLGRQMYEMLSKEGVNVTLILDASMGYIMEQIDLVLVGAEGVCVSGGIINKVSVSFQFSISLLSFSASRLSCNHSNSSIFIFISDRHLSTCNSCQNFKQAILCSRRKL